MSWLLSGPFAALGPFERRRALDEHLLGPSVQASSNARRPYYDLPVHLAQAPRRPAIIKHSQEVTGNVAMTCRYYGISRVTFHRWVSRPWAGPWPCKLAEQDLHSAPGRGRRLSRPQQISLSRSAWLSISPGSSRAAAGGGRRCWPGSGSGALRWRSTRRCLLHRRRTARSWARSSRYRGQPGSR
jgi:hypothetical protein